MLNKNKSLSKNPKSTLTALPQRSIVVTQMWILLIWKNIKMYPCLEIGRYHAKISVSCSFWEIRISWSPKPIFLHGNHLLKQSSWHSFLTEDYMLSNIPKVTFTSHCPSYTKAKFWLQCLKKNYVITKPLYLAHSFIYPHISYGHLNLWPWV